MFDRKSDYALNKKDISAIVYIDADKHIVRLTRENFASEEEFLRWKKWSDADYHETEKRDHVHANHMRTVSFELNGIRRDVQVPDEAAQQNIVKVPMADPTDRSQVGASIPGAVSKISVKVGDHVEENQPLMIIEAMKMETAISARLRGTVAELLISEGDTVKGGQLVAVIK